MCKALDIKYRDLMCDMPIRWNSTDKMLSTGLHLKKALDAVLLAQEWDNSVKEYLILIVQDWATLKEMAKFFDLFRQPTVKLQAD